MRFQGPLGIRSTRSGGEMEVGHIPVLAEEVMSMLVPAPGSLQIDATLGGGGHTERILEATDPDGRLLGLDADGAAIARVDGRLRPRYGDRLVLRQDLDHLAPVMGHRVGIADRALDLGVEVLGPAGPVQADGVVADVEDRRRVERAHLAEGADRVPARVRAAGLASLDPAAVVRGGRPVATRAVVRSQGASSTISATGRPARRSPSWACWWSPPA